MSTGGKIFQAIPQIMASVGHIEKTRTNQQGSGYKFRGIDDVYAALQPLLHKHGVFFVPNVLESVREERQSKSGGTLIYTVLRVEYTFFADDGSTFKAMVSGEAMDSGDKSSNKAMSAALKYVLLQVFCIPTEEEKDTEYQSPEVKPKAQPPVTVKPAQNAPGPIITPTSIPSWPVPPEYDSWSFSGGRYKDRLIKNINPKELSNYVQIMEVMLSSTAAVGTEATAIREALKAAKAYCAHNDPANATTNFETFK